MYGTSWVARYRHCNDEVKGDCVRCKFKPNKVKDCEFFNIKHGNISMRDLYEYRELLRRLP